MPLYRSTKKTKNGKDLNPTDAFRKQQRKREIKKVERQTFAFLCFHAQLQCFQNKDERKMMRETSAKFKNPDQIIEELKRVEREGFFSSQVSILQKVLVLLCRRRPLEARSIGQSSQEDIVERRIYNCCIKSRSFLFLRFFKRNEYFTVLSRDREAQTRRTTSESHR